MKKRSFVVDIFFFDFMAVPLTKVFGKFNWITPNLITIVAIIVSLGGIYFYLPGSNQNFLLGAIILIIGNVLDGTDGKVARLKGVQSEFGAKLDKHLDKVRKVIALAVLVYISSYNTFLLIGLIVAHYLLQYVKIKTPEVFEKIYIENGVKTLFEPLDALIILIIIGPLLGSFFWGLCITLSLQIFKILLYNSYKTPSINKE